MFNRLIKNAILASVPWTADTRPSPGGRSLNSFRQSPGGLTTGDKVSQIQTTFSHWVRIYFRSGSRATA